MTSREIIKRAISFTNPARLPVTGYGVSDTDSFPILSAEGFAPVAEGADEWGCIWTQTDVHNMGQVKMHPLEDICHLDRHPFPDYTDDSRYAQVPAALDAHEREGKYITGGIFMVLFERMHSLHGFENTLVDLYADRPAMEALADHVADVHITLVNEIARRFHLR